MHEALQDARCTWAGHMGGLEGPAHRVIADNCIRCNVVVVHADIETLYVTIVNQAHSLEGSPTR